MRLFFLLLISSSLYSCQSTAQPTVKKISNNELKDMVENNQNVQLIDVRTPEEVSFGIIKGAQHIDFYDQDFMERIGTLDKQKPIVLYCAAGGRSAKAASQLKELGFEEIYDLTGGFRKWKAEDRPIDTN